ncbi:MAG: hypothetical protein ETSY1_11695 [Candidatus Entotheonella factor]|uniref:Uncharacterized protein n=1 Tax=Entotheonella factor TaxID=1429438 RepID=W4LR28_ENTF1|nr:MAG: hypothetical protein ETSY1_11695 [Candidatus Entotheonella factor]
MQYRNWIRHSLLLFVTLVCGDVSVVDANTQAQKQPTSQSKADIFATRTSLKLGEHLHVQVWSERIANATATIFFAERQLQLEGTRKQPLKDTTAIFALRALRTGKSNIMVRIEGMDQITQKPVTVSRQIQNIDVQPQINWSSWFPASLFGVLLGALLTFSATWLHEQRQRRSEALQRHRWLTAQLPALLHADLQAVLNTQQTQFQLWTDKLLAEGYYTDLHDLAQPHANLQDMAQRLMQVSFRLRDYEDQRTRERLSESLQQELAATLADMATSLQNLR